MATDVDPFDIDINAIPDAPGDHPECRICGGGAEENAPLFHPCKCSGSIRYTHQACLTTWLKHSKKQACDLCKHSYSFTKVYQPNMPGIIPLHIIVKRIVKQFFSIIALGLRGTLVSTVWLAVVPYGVFCVWKLSFWSGDIIAWTVYGPPAINETLAGRPNFTLADAWSTINHPSTWVNQTLVNQWKELARKPEDQALQEDLVASLLPAEISFLNDIVSGQMITTCMVIIFLALFLLKEWVGQNAAPGMFDDENAIVEEAGDILLDPQRPADAMGDLAAEEDRPPMPVPEALPDPPPPNANRPAPQFVEGDAVEDDWDPDWEEDATGDGFEFFAQTEEEDDEESLAGDRETLQPVRSPTPHPLGMHDDFSEDDVRGSLSFTEAALRGDMAARIAALRAEADASPTLEEMSWSRTEGVPPRIPTPPNFGRFFASSTEDISGAGPSQRPMAYPPTSMTPTRLAFGETAWPSPMRTASTPSSFNGWTQPSPSTLGGPSMSSSTSFATSSASRRANGLQSDSGSILNEVNNDDRADSGGLGPKRAAQHRQHNPPLSGTFHAIGSEVIGDSKGKAKMTLAPTPDYPFNFTILNLEGSSSTKITSAMENNGIPPPHPSALLTGEPNAQLGYPDSLPGTSAQRHVRPSFAVTSHSASVHRLSTSTQSPFSIEDSNGPSSAPPNGLSNEPWVMPSNRIPSDFSFSFSASRDLATASSPRDHPTLPQPASSASPWAPTNKGQLKVSMPPPAEPTLLKRPPLVSATPNAELESLANGRDVPPSMKLPYPLVKAPTPRATPPLATYRAPEDLDGLVSAADYFREAFAEDAQQIGDEAPAMDDMEEEHHGDVHPPGAFPGFVDPLWDDPALGEGQGLLAVGPNPVEARLANPNAGEAEPRGEAVRDNDMGIGMVDEDIEGIIEAIGLRGPLFGLAQNALLVSVCLSVAVLCCVWTPYTVGRIVALLTLRPRRAIQLLNIPIKAVRVVTDPAIDLLVLVVQEATLPHFKRTGSFSIQTVPALRSVFNWANAFGKGMVARSTEASTTPYASWSNYLAICPNEVLLSTNPNPTAVGSIATLTGVINSLSDCAVLVIGPSGSRQLQRVCHTSVCASIHQLSGIGLRLMGTWEDLARGTQPRDKTLLAILGYVCVTTAVMAVIESLGSNIDETTRAVRTFLRQQVVVLKVGLFIVIELVIFPLGCGVLLDFNTLPLFANGSFQRRLEFAFFAPSTSVFLHWMLGTMFMYQFAVLLSSGRKIMRSGAMWFIKDPADPNFHPIRDIMERPVLAQLRKLSTSALMYSTVLTLGIGMVIISFREATSIGISYLRFFPLRTSMLEPLSEIPLDLLVLHIALPPTVAGLKPRKTLRNVLELYWKALAQKLGLTSYMFGPPPPGNEEQQPSDPLYSLIRMMAVVTGDTKGPTQIDGSLVRAPAADALVLPPGTSAFVRVNDAGVPETEKDEEVKRIQDDACFKAGINAKDAFVIVRVPPYFRTRLLLFGASLWALGIGLCVGLGGLPIFAGRAILHFLGRPVVHDAYSWTVGLYALLVTALLLRSARRSVRKGLTTPQRLLRKLSAKWFQRMYMVITIGIIIPPLTSLAVDCYLIIPIRLWLQPLTKPEVHLVESWAIGLIYAKIYFKITTNDVYVNFRRTLYADWKDPNAWAITKNFIFPVIAPLLMMIGGPPLLCYVLRDLHPLLRSELFIFWYGYPGIFAVAAVCVAAEGIYRDLLKWTQNVRDAEFLLEMRLSNLGDDATETVQATEAL